MSCAAIYCQWLSSLGKQWEDKSTQNFTITVSLLYKSTSAWQWSWLHNQNLCGVFLSVILPISVKANNSCKQNDKSIATSLVLAQLLQVWVGTWWWSWSCSHKFCRPFLCAMRFDLITYGMSGLLSKTSYHGWQTNVETVFPCYVTCSAKTSQIILAFLSLN